jgi:tetratricopeptide (TPR) repeat protein
MRSLFACLLVVIATIASPAHDARAEPLDGELAKLSAELGTAKPHHAYAILRRIWQRWEDADPAQVEAAFAAAQRDAGLGPAVRAYAAVLEGYARRRRGDLDGAVERLAAVGLVRDWLVVGPFGNDNRSGLKQVYLVEDELAQPVLFDRSFAGASRAVRWRRAPDVHRYGYLDLGAMLRPTRDICAYASTYVRADGKKQLSLWVGVTGAFALWFNDELVLSDEAYRDLDADRRGVVVDLHAGWNRVTAKVCGDESPPTLSLRVAEADGSAPSGVTVSVEEDASNGAAAAMRDAGPRKPTKAKRKLLGPLTQFEAELAAAGDKAGPELLEAFASYLSITGGEAEGSHEARDFSRRAADAAPTVARLLLAGRLAEDRNGRRAFVDRAAKLAKTTAEESAVLLEQARLARTSLNPRDAFPIYDEVLALDGDNVEAVLGKADLYVDAGLPRTALALLERASEARPQGVALLRALSSQLRELGRDADAIDVEARYSALRFDDGGFLQSQVEQAAARGDGAGTARWAGRLLGVEPASAWALGIVAQARLTLGDPEGALAAYQQALTIAPEDVASMRALSDLHGRMGQRDQQLAYLKQILRLSPQDKQVRAYVEHMQPEGERADEKLAWEPERFLEKRAVKREGDALRYLRKLQVTTVFESGLASRFHQLVYQPLSNEAVKRAQTFGFVYHADQQVVTLRAARVYRADGRVDEAVQSGEGPADDPSINMYTLQRTYYVQFPKLNVGDVVELRYRVDDVSLRNEKSDYFGEIAELQGVEPIASMEYVLMAPKARDLALTIGPKSSSAATAFKKRVSEQGEFRVTRVAASDVPPLVVEARMPRLGELLAHVHVSTFTSWKDVGAWYATLASDKADVDDDVRQLARKLVKGLTGEREKVAAIYRYVANDTRYVALEFGIEGIRPRRAAQTLARGWGDCKDKATLIVSMLSELGIGAELTIVRTGMRGGFESDTASLEPFDHAIVYVPSLDLYLDGTAESTGTAELPAMDHGAMGLRISGAEGKLVTLPEPEASASEERREIAVTLAASGDIHFKGALSMRGVDAPSWRHSYLAEATRRERVAGDLAAAMGPVELLDGPVGLKVTGLDALEEPVRLEVAGAGSAIKEGKGWAVPVGPKWALVAQLAPRKKRVHDLLLGPRRQHEEIWTVTIPPGMKVHSTPKTVQLANDFGAYELSVAQEGGKVVVRSLLRLDRVRIRPKEYAAWRKFCRTVDASSGARLLIGP